MSRQFGRPIRPAGPPPGGSAGRFRPAGRPNRRYLRGRRSGRPAGRPNRPPAVWAKFSAKILRGGLGRPISAGLTAARRFGRPSRPAEPPPSFSAEDRRRAPPPFHSDELSFVLIKPIAFQGQAGRNDPVPSAAVWLSRLGSGGGVGRPHHRPAPPPAESSPGDRAGPTAGPFRCPPPPASLD